MNKPQDITVTSHGSVQAEAVADRQVATDPVVEPFLHVEGQQIYNPLTDRTITAADEGFGEVLRLRAGDLEIADLDSALGRRLRLQGWLVSESGRDLATRFRLKYVSLEANSACNQACYFCPVSTDPRDSHTMTMEFYETIVSQLAEHKATIEGVSMAHYNEPTVDERLATLRRFGLPAAVLSNGTALPPNRVEEMIAMGGLCFLSINLSTLDPERYARERGQNHLEIVLRNVDYLSRHKIAPRMEIVVLGRGDHVHKDDFHKIRDRYANSSFEVKYYEVMNRGGNLPLGLKPATPHRRLCGCNQTGSRPLQWVHITPHGECVLCCQDYHSRYVIGDLNEQSLDEILSGPPMALLRRWVYGLEEAPHDFLCRGCIYARTH